MTPDPAARRRSVVQSFDSYLNAFARLDELMAETPEPRSAGMLLDVAGTAGVATGTLVLDAGCRDGMWAGRLTAQFGCRVVGVDLARERLREAFDSRGLPVAEADVAALPIASGSVDFVWCREVLSLVDDPARCLQDNARVLRPGGAIISWEAYPTAALTDDERAWFFRALDVPDWWAKGRSGFDQALSETELRVDFETPVAPESTEWLALHRPDDLIESIVRIAKMRRQRAWYETELGPWYQRMLAWQIWPLYLLLGKLQTYAMILRASR